LEINWTDLPLPAGQWQRSAADHSCSLCWRNIPKPSIAVQGAYIGRRLLLSWPCDLISRTWSST